MILIGSQALRKHFPSFPRDPSDLDYIVEKEKTNEPGVEYHLNPVLLKHFSEEILPFNALYTLKISHTIGWDVHWEKNMWDIVWMKEHGAILDINLFYELYEYWNSVKEFNKRSDLEMTAEDFFDNALKCEYSHDLLHTLINPIPTYTKILVGEVEVSEELFDKLSFEDKCNLVYEEVEIMAWERWPKLDFRVAYNKMLKKFIINHAPIWEAIFILENYRHLQKYRNNYFKIIENGIKQIK
jgi:hypothetical protein